MKTVGIILIIAGIAMLVFRGFSVQTEKEVLDIGPVEINKKENKWFTWPTYAGAIAIVAGIVIVAANSKKRVA
jgi:drug/metabolite transporter (DMT)-like permease